MPKRLVRSFSKGSNDFETNLSDHTLLRYFDPEIEWSYKEFGLDSQIKMGRGDLEKLGHPKRIKVVIYNLD